MNKKPLTTDFLVLPKSPYEMAAHNATIKFMILLILKFLQHEQPSTSAPATCNR